MSTQPGYQAPTVTVATALPKRGVSTAVLIVPVIAGDGGDPTVVADAFLTPESVGAIEAALCWILLAENPQQQLPPHWWDGVPDPALPVLPLVELVTTLVTTESAAARTEEFAGKVLGKQVVRCTDRSGFVVNFLLVPYLLSAISMVESGVATIEDVDKAVVAGLSHPMGPLRLSDLVGLDTLKLIADKLFDEFKEPLYAPPSLLLRMVEAGWLGKKSGQGFYTY